MIEAPALAARVRLLILLAGLSGCTPSPTEDRAERLPAPPIVSAVQARTMTLEPELELVGSTLPRPASVALMTARVAGVVVEVHVAEGDRVRAGDPLVGLDTTLFKAEVKRADAVVEERLATLERLVRGPLEQELDIAREAVKGAEAASQSAALRLEALEELRSHSELSPVRLAEATSQQQSADADLAAARAALALVEAGTRPELLQGARASLAAAQAELELARARLDFASVAAPFEGTVTRMQARLGLGVSPGFLLVEVADLSQLDLRVRVPAEALSRIDPQRPCTVSLGALDAPVEGRLARLGAVAEGSTGGVWAYVEVANAGDLRPGLSGRAVFQLQPVVDCTAIPVAAAAERAGTPVVTVIRDEQAFEIEVETGVRAGGWVQITAGISPGDWVAIEGGYGLPEGQAVQLAQETPRD